MEALLVLTLRIDKERARINHSLMNGKPQPSGKNSPQAGYGIRKEGTSSLYRAILLVFAILATASIGIGGLLVFRHYEQSETSFDFQNFHLRTTESGIAFMAIGVVCAVIVVSLMIQSYNRPPSPSEVAAVATKVSESQQPEQVIVPVSAPAEKDKGLVGHNYVILSRTVYSRYSSRTECTTTHDVVIECIRGHVTHYDGRHMVRANQAPLRIKSPHANVTFSLIESNFQKFFVQLKSPLTVGKTDNIISELIWHDPLHAEQPQSNVTLFVPTEKLRFVVFPPKGSRFGEAKGITRHHPGDHIPISEEDLHSDGECLIWEPKHIELKIHYWLVWRWV